MTLARVDAERVFLSTLGYLRASGGSADVLAVTREIVATGRSYGQTYNYSEYRSVVNRAFAAFEAAGQFGPDEQTAIPLSQLPIDPTIRPGEGIVNYRVVVEVIHGGHVVASTAVNVLDNQALTPEQIRQAAVQVAEGDRPGRDYPNEVANARRSGGDVHVYIVSAGRAQ